MTIQGEGHNENQPKSNQVIYRSGSTIMLKMKEIPKVVQKLLREQNFAPSRGGGAGGVGSTVQTSSKT